jgi:manganese transport protein
VACKYNLIDSVLALNGAFFVNAAILIMAVCTFFNHGQKVETLQDAHQLLGTVWGTTLASVLFAIALLASGQSSTLTGTLAGQVVMEGFVRLRLRPWLRRLLTRALAIVPALIVIALAGKVSAEGTNPQGVVEQTVDRRLLDLLVLSQVILSFQLPFAIVPLVHFTSDRRQMGEFVSRGWLKSLSWFCALVVVGLNAVLIYLAMDKWSQDIVAGGGQFWWIYGTVGTIALALAGFLAWVAIYPLWARGEEARRPPVVPMLRGVRYRRIGVAVELEGRDDAVLAQAVAVARANGARLLAIHVVEGFGADFHGAAAADQESRRDRERIAELASHLRADGLETEGILGYGKPADELIRLAYDKELDLLVVGTHGHGFLADLALGQTVAPVLHRLTIPVLVVPSRPATNPVTQAEDDPWSIKGS